MKLAIILVLSLITIGANGQTEKPFKGANKIIFECADSTDNLYKRLGRHLVANGYVIITDKDFLSINTKERGMSQYSYTYKINSVIKKNRVLFTMTVSLTSMWDWDYSNSLPNKIMYSDFMKAMEGFERLKTYYEKY